ncbi:MAG: endonuclease V [Granulosicoccus sp.]
MILATDVHYNGSTAIAAGVLFDTWDAAALCRELTCEVGNIEPYQSGSFYKRELPRILALLDRYSLTVDCIVIDGFVYLDDQLKPGLGKHLFDALNGKASVIGVAKSPFHGIGDEHKLYRGSSEKPIYITASHDLTTAKRNVLAMHGKFRLPTLLKRVDQLCRKGQ